MFLLTLAKISVKNTFHDPYIDGVNYIWKSFQSEKKAKEEMLRDFNERFDADSECTISDNRIEVRMADEKWIYSISSI